MKIKTVALLYLTTEVTGAKGFLSSKIRKVRIRGMYYKQYLTLCRLHSTACPKRSTEKAERLPCSAGGSRSLSSKQAAGGAQLT